MASKYFIATSLLAYLNVIIQKRQASLAQNSRADSLGQVKYQITMQDMGFSVGSLLKPPQIEIYLLDMQLNNSIILIQYFQVGLSNLQKRKKK